MRLTSLLVDTSDIDVSGNEAVNVDNKSFSYVTSGGYAHCCKQSVAFSYLNFEDLDNQAI